MAFFYHGVQKCNELRKFFNFLNAKIREIFSKKMSLNFLYIQLNRQRGYSELTEYKRKNYSAFLITVLVYLSNKMHTQLMCQFKLSLIKTGYMSIDSLLSQYL